MQIDRSNYEIWIIDWLDGKLDSREIMQLKLFLDDNPDLREEAVDLTSINLPLPGDTYARKGDLRRVVSDLSGSQFGYLCAAYLENDLDSSQKEELNDIITKDPERKKIFDLIKMTRISPSPTKYKNKRQLLRQTGLQKIVRLSVIGLSAAAAAAVVFIIVAHCFRPAVPILKTENTVHAIIPESPVRKPLPAARNNTVTGKILIKSLAEKQITKADTTSLMLRKPLEQGSPVSRIAFTKNIELLPQHENLSLVAPPPALIAGRATDEGSRAGRFLARTFREKLLKEDKPATGPVRGFEIASAGVNGLNKLFGWKMDLHRKTGKNGQSSSIYFKSKLLTVNAPVRKSESLP